MPSNLAEELALKVAVLPLEQQQAVLRLVETMVWGRFPQAADDAPWLPATDTAERTQLLHNLIARMKANPIPANAPRLTREELHERR